MKIVCPKCGQDYEVDKAQINAETDLECSACNTVFPFTPKPRFSSLLYMLKIIAIVVIGTVVALSCTVCYLIFESNSVTAELKKNTEIATESIKEAGEKLAHGDKLRSSAGLFFERLQQLEEISQSKKLTEEQVNEAKYLIREMKPFGSAMWSSLDAAAGKIILGDDAIKIIKDQMKKTAITEITKVINARIGERDALNRERWNNTENFQLGWNPSALYNIITAVAFFIVIIGFVFLYYKKGNML